MIIGSPSGCHAEQGIAAARKGLHVLVEKPIDVTTARVDAMLEEVDRAGVKLGVCFRMDCTRTSMRRRRSSTPAASASRCRVGACEVVSPTRIYSASRWRGIAALDGGGAVINQAIHTVDLLLWIFGPVARVYAQASTRLHSIEVEDTAVAVLEFASGAAGSLEATTSVYPGYPRRVELTGTEGTIVIEHDLIIRSDMRSGGPGVASTSEGDANASASSPTVSDTRGHQRIIRDFVKAIETGGTPICDGREGRRSVALVEAIYKSAKSGNRLIYSNLKQEIRSAGGRSSLETGHLNS